MALTHSLKAISVARHCAVVVSGLRPVRQFNSVFAATRHKGFDWDCSEYSTAYWLLRDCETVVSCYCELPRVRLDLT